VPGGDAGAAHPRVVEDGRKDRYNGTAQIARPIGRDFLSYQPAPAYGSRLVRHSELGPSACPRPVPPRMTS
jgi:hypothetical protein